MLLQAILACVSIVIGIIIYSRCWLCYIKYNHLGLKYHLHDLFNTRHNKIVLSSKPGKIAIVTGGSRGIGAYVVKKLLQCDMEVILACRTTSAGEKLILEIRKSGITSGKVKVYKLDNSSLESVREFAKQIKTDYDKIHVLINNAGVMWPAYRLTEDGYEEQWMVNYLSHFLLTSLLLPLLKIGGHPSECSRIINISSCAHNLGTINLDYISNGSNAETLCTHKSYGQSKLAQTMFTITLQRLLKDKSLNILVYTVHPGVVKTDLFKESLIGKLKWLMAIWKTPDEAGTTIMYAAVNKDIENKGGIYISNCKELALPRLALQKDVQKRLFELSLKQVHLKDFF